MERQGQNSVFWTWQNCYTHELTIAMRLPAQDLHKLKPTTILYGVRRSSQVSTLSWKTTDSWWLLEEEESIFINYVTSGYTSVAPHPEVSGQHKLELIGHWITKKRTRSWMVREVGWLWMSKQMSCSDYDQNTLFEILKELIIFLIMITQLFRKWNFRQLKVNVLA